MVVGDGDGDGDGGDGDGDGGDGGGDGDGGDGDDGGDHEDLMISSWFLLLVLLPVLTPIFCESTQRATDQFRDFRGGVVRPPPEFGDCREI